MASGKQKNAAHGFFEHFLVIFQVERTFRRLLFLAFFSGEWPKGTINELFSSPQFIVPLQYTVDKMAKSSLIWKWMASAAQSAFSCVPPNLWYVLMSSSLQDYWDIHINASRVQDVINFLLLFQNTFCFFPISNLIEFKTSCLPIYAVNATNCNINLGFVSLTLSGDNKIYLVFWK